MSSQRHAPWIKWNAEQNAYDQALREGPTAALDHFRTLVIRQASPSSMSDNDELLLLSQVLMEQFEMFLDETMETNEGLWRASIESEFILFLTAVISGPGFFDHILGFAVNICRMLVAILHIWGLGLKVAENKVDQDGTNRNATRRMPSGLSEAFWSAAETMWMSLWDRRGSFARVFSSGVGRAISIGFDRIAYMMQKIRNRIFVDPGAHPVMVQVAYCSWVYLHGSELLTEAHEIELPSSHHALMLVHDHYERLCKTDDGNSVLPQSHVFVAKLAEATDARTAVRAARNALSYSESLIDDHLSFYIQLLSLQMKVIGLHRYSSMPLMDAFSLALSRQVHASDPQSEPGVQTRRNTEVCGEILEHIRAMLPGLKTGAILSASFPGYKLWDVLVAGLFTTSHADTLLHHVTGHCERGDHTALAEGLSTLLDRLFALLNSLISAIRLDRLPRSVVENLRDSGVKPRALHTSGIWHNEVRHLRHSLRQDPSSTTYITLLDTWVKLGDTLGIDETYERDLEAANKARRCSWRLCVYHSKPSDKPLLVCKGCKEARYCSAACQRSDWKQGGHRTDCRRVK
ncbi:hypothetical protein PENSPDRAFT_756982 [Peniophora sp. CONT]|nr:hypothetical protein PENSPDRAFT_756982 [Peniophora sp. CONT]